MIANSACQECCLNNALKKAAALPIDHTELKKLQNRIRVLASALSGSESAPSLLALLTDELRPYTDIDAPFLPIKAHFNELMLTLEDELYADINSSTDPLSRAIQYAMTGNYIDFGALHKVSESELRRLISESSSIPLPGDTMEKLRKELGQSKKLLYISDNCGEIVMDKLLIKTILSLFPALDITLMVRGRPAQNDATIEDAAQVGLCGMVEVTGNGRHAPGTPIEGRLRVDEEIISIMKESDIVLAKGQGNFETLCGCGWNVYYLFLCKCENFTSRFGLKQFAGVLANDKDLNIK